MEYPLKILIADDSPTVATFLKMSLKKQGYEVVMARDGIEAVEAAYRESPDLIVSDVIMPRLNGYQVCRLLRDDQAMNDMPIILLTSLEERVDKFWGMKSGANLYLTKGKDMKSLVSEIEEFIRASDLADSRKASEKFNSRKHEPVTMDIIGRVIQLLDKSLFESTVLNDIGELVNALEDYEKTMFNMLRIFSEVVDFDLGLVLLRNNGIVEYYTYINGPICDQFIEKARLAADRFMVEKAGLEEMPSDFRMEISDPHKLKLGKGARSGLEIRSTYLHKLITKNQPSGVIGLFSKNDKAFSGKITNTFDIVFRQANIVIDYARLYERNKQLSITDGLTMVYNHRYFQECLKREFARNARHKLALSLVMLDIDHFKMFNDSYGHQQGDAVLRELAALLKREVRTEDVVSRYGGEEFTIIMPNAGLSDAANVSERLRKSIEDHDFPGPEDEKLKVTVSIGVAAIPHDLICNPAQMISSADRALYEAKKNGRNRVEKAF